MGRSLSHLFRLHRYPKLIADAYATYWIPWRLRRNGLSVGSGTRFIGAPILSLAAGSSIEIGRRCLLISRGSATALGVNHAMVIRTLRSGAHIKLGDGFRASGVTICAASEIVVGARCVIGANATIVDTDFHSLDPVVRTSTHDAQSAVTRPVELGDDVFIGGGSYVLKGVRIGPRAVVGAGSVVTGEVAAGAIVAGNPARQVGLVLEPRTKSRT